MVCENRYAATTRLMVVGVMKSFVVAITLVMTKLHQEGFVGNGGLQEFRKVVRPADYWRKKKDSLTSRRMTTATSGSRRGNGIGRDFVVQKTCHRP